MSWDLFSAAAARVEGVQRASLPARGGDVWTVSEINAAARDVVEDAFPAVRVAGEVTNWTRARSGHCYFSLRDAEAQLRCVMWRTDAHRLPTAPVEGMQVHALGRLTLYEGRGEFQLSVSDLEARGDGLWKLAYDRLRARLDAEGLTAPHRKRPLPRCPARVGVVTSPSGAALRDILSVIRRRAPWAQVVLCGCRVQGDGAAAEIARAIRRFAEARCVEVLIVGRGGGSREDLWAFNEEAVARALAESPIPTISAVGHETDVSIADLVADLRAPTPSAAAEAAVADGAQLRRELGSVEAQLRGAVAASMEDARIRLEGARSELLRASTRAAADRRERLGALAGRLGALSPLAALGRGFAVPLGSTGSVLRSVHDLPLATEFTLRLGDGRVPCRVIGPPLEEKA